MRSGSVHRPALILAAVLLAGPFLAADGYDLSGYYKSFFNIIFPGNIESNEGDLSIPDMGMFSSKFRLKFSFSPAEWLSFRAEYEVTPAIIDKSILSSFQLISSIDPPDYRITDIPDRLYPGASENEGNFYINQNLDRIYAALSFKFADVYIGRQIISWGSAYTINPTDIISPFSFNEIDKEEKTGVDAIRIRIPAGTMDEIDVGYIFGKNGRNANNAFFIRGKFNMLRTDLAILALRFRNSLMFGFDVSRSIGGAGFRFETAFVLDQLFENSVPGDDYFRLSAGLDYNFSDKVYAFFEYHYNSPGKTASGQYSENVSNAYSEGSVYLLGKHYLSTGFNYQLHPLIPFSGLIMYNISDHSLILSPSFEYNISENIYLGLGGFISIGRGIETGDTGEYVFRSEFGSYPHLIYTSFRIYF